MLREWTLPQTLFTYLGIQESIAADSRQEFLLTMAAIGAVFSKDGKKIAGNILHTLDGGPISVEDVFDQLDETQQLVLFGKDKVDKLRGHQKDTDPDTN